MIQVFWFTGAVAAVAAIWALATSRPDGPEAVSAQVAFAGPEVKEPVVLPPMNGSALATAAFGMSALQPETYNGEMVEDLILASPLELVEKRKLKDALKAAEAGEAELADVLSNVRMALAVE